MKKIAIYYFSLAAIVGSSLVSCQDDDQGFDYETVREAALTREFTKNFEDRYGKIDPNHTWGFDVMPTSDALTRVNVANKNQWHTRINYHIPGYPDIYYNAKTNQTINAGYHVGDNGSYSYKSTDPKGSPIPCGDVTDEEIQYVSWWFRTHTIENNEVIHWTDFFIQEISSDNDRNPDGTVLNTTSIYVQNAGGDWVLNTTQTDNYSMDEMEVKAFIEADGSGEIPGYDHVYNFNAGKSNKLHNVASVPMTNNLEDVWAGSLGNTNVRNIGFYTSSGTENFACHYAQDNKWRDCWKLVHLVFVGESGRLYDGYYLGFDYARTSIEGGKKYVVERDGYYSNWIVKLSPATPMVKNSTFNRRIMCEDLGNTLDFDFNDIVFDATFTVPETELDNLKREGFWVEYNEKGEKITHTGVDVTITIQAAGGTMPIYVGYDPDIDGNAKYEAHSLLDNESTTPVNVGGASHAVAIYHYNLDSSFDLDLIPIYVINNGAKYKINSARANLNNYHGGVQVTDKNSSEYSLAPQKFAVPCNYEYDGKAYSVRWLKETMQIETSYPHFGGDGGWVTNPTGNYCELRADCTTGNWSNPWFHLLNIDSNYETNLMPGTITNTTSTTTIQVGTYTGGSKLEGIVDSVLQ